MQDLHPIREATIWYIKKIVRNAKSCDFEREVDAIGEKGRNNLGSCVCVSWGIWLKMQGQEEHFTEERIERRKQEACPDQWLWLLWETVGNNGMELKKLGRAEL